MIELTLSDRQAQLLDDYLFKKICRLKDAGLEDSDCFKEFSLIHDKLRISRKSNCLKSKDCVYF